MSAPISVVIPNLHSALLGEVIDAMARQTARHEIAEIIVVGQDRYGLARAPARFIETPRPVPPGRARNLGASAARGEWLMFIDADCIAADDLVERMIARAHAGARVICGGVMVEPINYWTVCDNLIVFRSYLDSAEAGTREFLPSLNLFVRRDVLARAGGFNEHYYVGEDTDLSLRLRAMGETLSFEPRARVAHRPPRATPRAVWEHLRTFGRVHVRMWSHYPRLLPPPFPLGKLRLMAPMLRVIAPLLAIRDVYPLAAGDSHLLPGLIWARVAWYWGIAEGITAQKKSGG